MSAAAQAPRDMHATQYAAWLCENRLAMPANQANIRVIADSIDAIAKSKFREEKWKHPVFTAFIWLDKRCEFAQMAKTPINHLFFLNAGYLDVAEPEKVLPPFEPCGKCNFGWIYQHKDGKCTGRVEQCECRRQWVAAAKVAK